MKYFNGGHPSGRATLREGSFHVFFYIAAKTQKRAVELGQQVWGRYQFSRHQLKTYWAECWGTAGKECLPKDEEGLWAVHSFGIEDEEPEQEPKYRYEVERLA